MASGWRGGGEATEVAEVAGEGEGQAHVRRVTARSAARSDWEEMDRERLRCAAQERRGRDVCVTFAAAGATEKGAPLVECLTAQVPHRAVCQRVAPAHGRGRARRSRRREKFAKSW